jgi:hypothetical protein
MNKETLIKLFALFSVIAIALAVFFYFNKNEYLFWLSLLSNIIQIVLFGFWLFKNQSLPIAKIENTNIKVNEIHPYITKEKEVDKRKMRIMAQLMDSGLVPGEEIKKAFNSLKLEEVIVMHTYGEGIRQNLLNEIGLSKQPLITLVENLGFIRVFKYPSLYITFKKNLPRILRSLDNLENYINSELNKEWEKIKKSTNEKYPSEKYKIYANIRDGSGFKCSYILLKSLKEEFIVNYQNKPSFTKKFTEKVLTEYQSKKNVLKSIEIKNFILKIKLGILIDDSDKAIMNQINKNDKQIKESLRLRYFFDLKNRSNGEIKKCFDDLNIKENDLRIDDLRKEANEYYIVLKEINLI